MNPLLKHLLARCMGPAGDDGADTGGTATLEDPAGNEEPEDRGDVVDPSLTEENLRSLVDSGGAEGGKGQDGADGGGADTEDDGAGDGAARAHGIPKARFNEVNEQRKALAAENEELRRALDAAKAGTAAPALTPAAKPQHRNRTCGNAGCTPANGHAGKWRSPRLQAWRS